VIVAGRSERVVVSLFYWSLRRLLELLVLRRRSEREKELEICVPRTQKESAPLPGPVLTGSWVGGRLRMGRSTEGRTGLSEQRKYRMFTAQQKLEIVLGGLRGDRSVREVCREHAISETLFYGWRD
jgi:hypothetical protein